uniref:Uncharacterized protein n=1 Tax=viral metagenome TaxID=1070528 RepID=A0A6C0CQZ5_9ZZZZ
MIYFFLRYAKTVGIKKAQLDMIKPKKGIPSIM